MTLPSFEVTVGDCVEVMRGLPDGSVDAVVCDPPYELGFMGKAWDGSGIAYSVGMWSEVLRVLRPGGHLLAFGGTRTFHRMTVAIEDAGFEVRDCLSWLYGSGFPKSLNVGKAIDKAAGAEREVLRQRTYELTDGGGYSGNLNTSKPRSESAEITAPATPEAARWEGWGTALKPAWEPVVLARKPLVGTVAANVLEHGTGGLNIDGSRIATDDNLNGGTYSKGAGDTRPSQVPGNGIDREFVQPSGRWPANVLLDEEAAAILDQQSGVSKSGAAGRKGSSGFAGGYDGDYTVPYGDSGGASRFFYVAKASRRDRNEGLDGMPEKDAPGSKRSVPAEGRKSALGAPRANHHPTVKPTTLMRHLVRLVTPPDGLILDPFCGSGSTGKAAMLEGFRFHGIEQDAEYAEIARRRIGWAAEEAARQPPTLGV